MLTKLTGCRTNSSLYKTMKTCDPRGWPIFGPRGIIQTNYQMICYIRNSKALGLWFQTRRFFKFLSRKSIFSLSDLDMQQTITIWTIIKEGHIRIIPAKFCQNRAISLGSDVHWSNIVDDTQRTTRDGPRTSNDHKSSQWANDTDELECQHMTTKAWKITQHAKG